MVLFSAMHNPVPKQIATHVFCFFLSYGLGFSSLTAQLIFQKTYGGAQDDQFHQVRQTSTGGFTLAGTSYSQGQGERDLFMVQTDVAGTSQWSRTFGGTDRDVARDVIELSNGGGGLLLVGNTLANPPAGDLATYARYDMTGNQTWFRVVGGIYDNELYKGLEVLGGFAFCGFSNSYSGNGYNDMTLVRTDANGNVLFANHYGGWQNDQAFDFQQTSDGGFVLAGRSASFSTGANWDMYVVKVNLAGTVQWARTIGGAGTEEAWSVRQTSDGGYLVAGFTTSYGAGGEDMFLVKLSANGGLSWARTYGSPGNDRAYEAEELPGGRYALAGFASQGNGGRDAALLQLNANQTIQWAMSYGGTQNDEAWAMDLRNSPQGGYLLAGFTQSFGNGGMDAYLIATDTLGNSGCQQSSINLSTASHNPTIGGTASLLTGFQSFNRVLTSAQANYPEDCSCSDYSPPQSIQGNPLVCDNATGVSYWEPSLYEQPQLNWSVQNGTISGQQSDTLIFVDFTGQNSQIRVEADFGSCTVFDLDTLDVVISEIAVDILGDSTSCEGETFTLNTQVTGGTGNLQFAWSSGATSPSISDAPMVSTGYQVTVTDSLGCTAEDSLWIQVFPFPVVNLGPDSIVCNPPNLLLNAGNPGAGYLWNDGSTQQTTTANTMGFWWVDVSRNGCTTRDSIEFIQAPAPQVQIAGDSQLCIGESTTLTAQVQQGTGPFSFEWSNQSNQSTAGFTPVGDQLVWVQVTDQNQCVDQDTLNLVVYNYPVVDLGPDLVVCTPPPILLDAGNLGASYQWQDGSNSQLFAADTTALYWVAVTQNNCTSFDSIQITFDSLPEPALPEIQLMCANNSVTLDAGNPFANYQWSTGDTSRTLSVSEPGVYSVWVSKCNVVFTDSVRVVGGYDPERIYVPNAFSPNDDGMNDRFGIAYSFPELDLSDGFEMYIFDRWGNVVKRFQGPEDSWNGTGQDGNPLSAGVYAWRMYLNNFCFPDIIERIGSVRILR